MRINNFLIYVYKEFVYKLNFWTLSSFFVGILIFIPMGLVILNITKLNSKINDFFIKKNIIVECFSTPTACRAYNVTISSHRKAGALLMPI